MQRQVVPEGLHLSLYHKQLLLPSLNTHLCSLRSRQSVDLDAPSVQTLVGCDQHSTSQMETLRLEWPLTTLRQFAFHGCLFKMETGRRAPHGEGHYLFRIPNITMFRQNLEAHIKHQKRSRSLKTRSAVCCPSTVLSPPPSVPPPPPPLVISNQTYVNIPLFPPKLNRSWTNLLQPNAEIAGRAGATEGCNDNGEDDSDWMVELSSPPPPPPASAPPLSQEIDAQSPLIDQPPLHRIGTYENVRSLLQSQETKSATSRSATVAPHFFGKDVVSTATSTLNYAMLDFQLPSNTASAIATYTGNLTVRSPPLQPHSTPLFSSSSCERLVQVPSTRLSRRLARSMEAQLNAVRGSGEAERPMSMTGSGVGGNYVDICPLQTLAINELLRSTL